MRISEGGGWCTWCNTGKDRTGLITCSNVRDCEIRGRGRWEGGGGRYVCVETPLRVSFVRLRIALVPRD